MKVKELIKALLDCDPEATIGVDVEDTPFASMVVQYNDTGDGRKCVYICDDCEYLNTVVNNPQLHQIVMSESNRIYYHYPGEHIQMIYNATDSYSCFVHASKLYAFDDIEPIIIDKIIADGKEVDYAGWEPGMRFVFYDPQTKDIVFDVAFPEWDH